MDSETSWWDDIFALSDETRELYIPSHVRRIEKPSPLEFYREYIAKNVPVIITGGISHWPALKKWNNDYLSATLGDKEITVDITPDGYADSIVGESFVQPECRPTTLRNVLDTIKYQTREKPESEAAASAPAEVVPPHLLPLRDVYYIQHQNDNFNAEFSILFQDVDRELAFASEAFGTKPDAINIWMGPDKAVTSLHKDNYENIYAVVSGTKHFTLVPPTDIALLYERPYTSARYVSKPAADGSREREWDIVPDEPPATTPWISVAPNDPDVDAYPRARLLRPLQVTVNEGEILYLPSMWFHEVRQTASVDGRTIAVNYWYDMQFDIKYTYFKFLERAIKHVEDQEAREDGEEAEGGEPAAEVSSDAAPPTST